MKNSSSSRIPDLHLAVLHPKGWPLPTPEQAREIANAKFSEQDDISVVIIRTTEGTLHFTPKE